MEELWRKTLLCISPRGGLVTLARAHAHTATTHRCRLPRGMQDRD